MSTPTLNGSYPHVYSADPALDTDSQALDLEGFKERADTALVPAKTGETVTRFQLRHLRGLARRRAQSYIAMAVVATGGNLEAVVGELAYRLASLGLAAIEPGSSLHCPGAKPLPKLRLRKDEDVLVVAEEVMAQLDEIDDGALVVELGVRVMEALKPSPK